MNTLSPSSQNLGRQLIKEVLAKGSTTWLQLNGHSMHPLLRPGEKVEIKSTPFEQLVPGDIIAYEGHSTIHCHRIIRKRQSVKGIYLLTKGDANLRFDEPVTPEMILGKVMAVHKKGRRVILGEKGQRITNSLVAFFSYLIGFACSGRIKENGSSPKVSHRVSRKMVRLAQKGINSGLYLGFFSKNSG